MMRVMAELREDVLGVPLTTAARVIGVSPRRLIGWDDHGLVHPASRHSSGKRHVWSYGLDDIVLGRIVRSLELTHRVHVRQIRSILEAVRHVLGEDYSASSLIWAVAGDEAFVQYPDGSWHGGRQPYQAVLGGVLDLNDVRTEVRRGIGDRRSDAAGHTERRRGLKGGREVFAGTRIPVRTITDYITAGHTDERILRSFPSLGVADLEVARRNLASAS